MINPAMAGRVAFLAASVTPLRLGAALIEVDTGTPGASERRSRRSGQLRACLDAELRREYY